MIKAGTYIARNGAPFKKKEAKDIGEFVYKIPDKSTEHILEEIKKYPKHIIHSYIEWNDKIASKQYRLQQVRNIVNHIEIVIRKEYSNKPIRAFVSVKQSKDTDKPTYIDVQTVFTDEYQRRQVIRRALTELINWRDRYEIYTELTDIITALTPYLDDKKIA